MNTPRVSREQADNTITVTGCGDCPMYEVQDGYHYCKIQKEHEMFLYNLMAECPLPLTIQLKQDAPET
jgi:hypothetical protein